MRRAAILVSLLLAACGYRAVYGGADGERLRVVVARSIVADALAADDVAIGVREELAREGALAAGEGYPRVEIEVTRIDESSEGVAAITQADGTRAPRARATDVGVVARAWIVRTEGGPRERDTGDVRAIDATSAPLEPTLGNAPGDLLRHDDAVRATARRLGTILGRRVLGAPSPTDEATGVQP